MCDVTYPEGVHPQQVQINASHVRFRESLNLEMGDMPEWVDSLCMFWSTLVVFLWYKTCKRLSLNDIGQTLASALQSTPELDIDAWILTFADYLTRIGLEIREKAQKYDKYTTPDVVVAAIRKIGQEKGKPTIVQVIQDIKKSNCGTVDSARSELKNCIENLLKKCSTRRGDLVSVRLRQNLP